MLSSKYLILLLLSVPVAWWLGLDQFVFYFVFVLLFCCICNRGRICYRHDQEVLLYVTFFVLSFFISSVALYDVDNKRYFSYVRDGLNFLVFLVLLFFYHFSAGDFFRVVKAAVIFIFFCSFVSILSRYLGIVDTWVTFSYYLAPDIVSSSDFGRQFFIKTLVSDKDAYLFNSNVGPRSKSFFLFSNTFAVAIVVLIPFVFMWLNLVKSFAGKAFLLFGLFLCFLALVYTTSRAAPVALLGGLLGALLLCFISVSRQRIILFLLMPCLVLVLSLFFYDSLLLLYEKFAYSRGAGSVESRSYIYYQSLLMSFEHPLGFGAYRDSDIYGYPPFGSHSNYVSVIFKYGWLGFLSFSLLMFCCLRRLLNAYKLVFSKENRLVIFSLTWSFITLCLVQFTSEVSLDLITWFICSLIVVFSLSSKMLVDGDLYGEKKFT